MCENRGEGGSVRQRKERYGVVVARHRDSQKVGRVQDRVQEAAGFFKITAPDPRFQKTWFFATFGWAYIIQIVSS